MTTVIDHYQTHLAPVYAWMVGGADAAMARGAVEIADTLPALGPGHLAVDLGAGFGMHALPLARHGCSVIAIDSSDRLLEELTRQAGVLPVRAVTADILSFPMHLNSSADAVLCMGDTLTHLPDEACVAALCSDAAAALRPGGRFVTSFRDYTQPLIGAARFIPVRSDADRIMTCILEYGPDRVDVHDLLHERHGADWSMRVSSYRKLRLSPNWVAAQLGALGMTVRVEAGLGGMTRIVAIKP